MLPIIELRGGLPYGIAFGMDYPVALVAAVLGNLLPVPFVILFIRHIFAWIRKVFPKCDAFIIKLEKKAHLKGEIVQKYSVFGLFLFVAIPLPGTGAWTGALIAAMLDIRLKKAVPAIILGVLSAAMIITIVTYGALFVFG